ncbi:hypothetical protein DYD21_20330 [Rhodohalobacter sp. SW132]|nr:hypothetical protein DYD21_20330 [Rhodohalobacter sp. SW132]
MSPLHTRKNTGVSNLRMEKTGAGARTKIHHVSPSFTLFIFARPKTNQKGRKRSELTCVDYNPSAEKT